MRSFLVFLLTMTISAAAGLLFTYPLAGAIVCPSCFGFRAIADNVYTDTAIAPQDRRAFVQTLRQARDKVRAFYGDPSRDPPVFLCSSEECYRRYGGPSSRGTAFLDLAVTLAPDAVTLPIATHELSHVEFHARIGLLATVLDRAPRWFDEGLAINVSDDPQYLLPGTGRARCRLRGDETLPVSRGEWLAEADGRLYAVAACRVAEWLAANGGSAAVHRLTGKIAGGASFDEAYAGALRRE